MAADSVGQIGLDLVVNQNQFKQQMAGIQGLAKKAGAALAAAFAVKKLVDFGAACVELGSRLAEVDNVIQQAIPSMEKQVDSFAKNAIEQFGMSETAAKRFTGVFASMARGFGFSEKSAASMGMTLTGLAADVASFYDTSQDEAYTKLKSVFTGETETLKDLGIVMTQSALDSYALANGYGKVTSKMSEAEKVALRYAFVQEKLRFAQGDFARTSDSWANQVRILTERFNALKATIGQGLINVLTPVIQVINRIISKLMSLANAFKAFTEMVTGKKGGGGASAAAAGMDAMAQSADKAGAAAGGAGSAAKKAAKDMKSATAGIDELNIINPDTDSGGGGSGGSADGGYSADEFDMGEVDTSAVDEMDSKYAGLIEKANELKNLFMAGFKVGFGDMSVLDSMRESIQSIKDSLTEIFTSPEVEQAATRFANILAINLGKIAGSAASIGASIADNLLGGISLFLQQNKDRVIEYIVSMFDIGSRIAEISGNFSKALATVFSSLRSNSAKQITADIIGIFSEAFMGGTELAGTFAADVLDAITAPFVENADYIRTTLEDTFSAVEPIFSTIKDLVVETFEKIGTTYDERVAPMLATFKQGFTEIGTLLLDVYNTYFLPVLQNLSGRFVEFKDQYLSPLIDKFLEFGGKVADAVTKLWTGVIQPFIEWFITNVAPIIAANLQAAIDTFFGFWESVSGIIEGLLTALGGVIDFIVGVFTGDWSLAWEGIKEIFSGIWEALKELVSGAVTFIQNVVNMAWTAISGATSTIWNGIKALLNTLWNWLKSLASTLFNTIKTTISTAWENVKSKTSEIWEGIKEFVSGLWDTVKTNAETIFNGIKDSIVGVWNTLKEETSKIWNGIKDVIKGVIDSIITGVEGMVNRVIDGINAMIDAVNSVASKLPGVSDEAIKPLNHVSLPRVPWLAQGGFVRANTPQLAMIGDNRHHGEIVAPEDKMQEMVDRAVAMASQKNNSSMSEYYLGMIVELLKNIIDLIERMDLTVNIDIREIKKKLVELDKRSGYSFGST